MPNYRRWRVAGGRYFFTVTLHDRRATLLVDRIHLLRRAFAGARAAHPFAIDAMVVLPDHLHCIWTLPHDDADFTMRWRQIKAAFSRELPNTEPASAVRRKRGERGIWQRRFWEHVLRDDDDFARHVDYIHYNPVKHGYAKRPIDWPHSSLHRYVDRGVLPRDWGTSGIAVDMDLG